MLKPLLTPAPEEWDPLLRPVPAQASACSVGGTGTIDVVATAVLIRASSGEGGASAEAGDVVDDTAAGVDADASHRGSGKGDGGAKAAEEETPWPCSCEGAGIMRASVPVASWGCDGAANAVGSVAAAGGTGRASTCDWPCTGAGGTDRSTMSSRSVSLSTASWRARSRCMMAADRDGEGEAGAACSVLLLAAMAE